MMIKVRYFAAEMDSEKYGEFKTLFSNSADNEHELMVGKLEYVDGVKTAQPISNYANFFGQGIDLFDNSVTLGDENDYFGYITPADAVGDAENVISITWDGTKTPNLSNGISILFNKYTCKRAILKSVDDSENETVILDVQNDNELPENLHFDFSMDADTVHDNHIVGFKIEFLGLLDYQPINIQGIALGKIIDIDNIMSFDMLSETNPIGDDLSINETNISAVIEDDFFSEYGQKVFVYDDEELIEENIVKSIEETDTDIYDFKIRSKVDKTDKIQFAYPFSTYGEGVVSEVDWGRHDLVFESVLNAMYDATDVPLDAIQDDGTDTPSVWDTVLSWFYPPSNLRQVLQQLSWASCCGIDTTYSDKVMFVPFYAKESVTPDITISNDDDRILKTSVKKGTIYSKIVWKKTKYKFGGYAQDLGTYNIEQRVNGSQFGATIVKDVPFEIERTSLDESTSGLWYSASPFVLDIGMDDTDVSSVSIEGWEAKKYEETVEILTGNSNGETLEITNQMIYPIDDTAKKEQLKKWYSHNNTLSATVVDNDSEIRVGKVVKIQLKKGGYFQGIVTSVVRNNVSVYHTVDLEAHEWN